MWESFFSRLFYNYSTAISLILADLCSKQDCRALLVSGIECDDSELEMEALALSQIDVSIPNWEML